MFETVLSALAMGFLQTLKLFAVTLLGAIPLGLVICMGSMNAWAPLRRLQTAQLPRVLAWLARPCRWLAALRPISLLCRLFV